MRIFTASLATETNTFSPVPTDRASFEMAFYAGPGKHPDTPTLCSSPMVALRRRAAADGLTVIEGTATWAEPGGLVQRQTFEALRDEILSQLKAALALAGASLDQVVKTTCYLKHARDFAEFNTVYAAYFPKAPPARTTVEARLMADILVEIDAIAYAPAP
jgi:enamine deaminase RidA (YjgF/YER057c/UK114 family)